MGPGLLLLPLLAKEEAPGVGEVALGSQGNSWQKAASFPKRHSAAWQFYRQTPGSSPSSQHHTRTRSVALWGNTQATTTNVFINSHRIFPGEAPPGPLSVLPQMAYLILTIAPWGRAPSHFTDMSGTPNLKPQEGVYWTKVVGVGSSDIPKCRAQALPDPPIQFYKLP